ncbi:sodium/hydrogen exchanger [Allgaiera indica]|uniref:Sodium/hydrogen exchanger n=1 Tax=Allgaiera indica TaxID=765699 RepID=A0AAN4ZYP5_9RHOB|nr:sodium:proton antiporter [Allgaiera indica]GHE00621.1 sodium/hydrogen exchanger [Allgaiera indica]SDW58766.1 sodium/proton antiporter, CPA1 family [Allgaiera indica]
MSVAAEAGALGPAGAFALVGALGVGAQWLAWRLHMPAIVLMLVAGVLVGPVAGLFDPAHVFGDLMGPMIQLAVAVILFEGGLSLDFAKLGDARAGVRRLIYLGGPLGWLFSALALHYVAGLGWAGALVFGGLMIVTGPTVIAPLLRQARLPRRPAALLQWEAIVGDPLGALAAVLAFEVVLVAATATSPLAAVGDFAMGIAVAALLGAAAGWALSRGFQAGRVPEYMKVPVLFAVLLVVFAVSDAVLHESGLLAVTVMGVWIANAGLPSYDELRRFKEHATVLLVSGVFILMAASLDLGRLAALDWHAWAFVAVVILVVRPLTATLALAGSAVPWRERLLIALTAPRGIVLVAVAALFGARLDALGIDDGTLLGPLAFVLVAVTVVLHGFALKPLARALGLGGGMPGVLVIGASRWGVAMAEALASLELPVLVADPNHRRLRRARSAGLPVFMGDILSEAAEHSVELVAFGTAVAATDNDAYNTLVATDLGPEFGRDNVYQTAREQEDKARHALPSTLGGRSFGGSETAEVLEQRMIDGWTIGVTRLTEEFGYSDWRDKRPDAMLLGWIGPGGRLRFVPADAEVKSAPGTRLIAMLPPEGPAAPPAEEGARLPG